MKRIEPVDQKLFEPDEKKEPTRREIALRYLRGIVGFIAILGLLYISGVYQFLFYRKTPSTVEQERVESAFDAEMLRLPLGVFVFADNSQRTEKDVRRLVENASKIWEQASIELEIEKLVFLKVDDKEIQSFLSKPRAFAASLPDYNSESINIFLPRLLGGLNGIAFNGLGIVAVADYTTVYDFRVLGHEIGHILGLEHSSTDQGRLMFKGTNGFNLTLEEIIQARETVLNFNQ